MDPVTIAVTLAAAFGPKILQSLFGDSPEDERKRRKAELLAQLAKAQSRAMSEGLRNIQQTTAGNISQAQAGAAQRAAALGRTDQTEAFVQPVVGQVAAQGSESARGFTEATNRYYDQAQLGIEQDFANRPIEPGWSDFLTEAGGAIVQGMQDEKLLGMQKEQNQNMRDIMKSWGPQNPTETATTFYQPPANILEPSSTAYGKVGGLYKPRNYDPWRYKYGGRY